jgi:hypothetical protein
VKTSRSSLVIVAATLLNRRWASCKQLLECRASFRTNRAEPLLDDKFSIPTAAKTARLDVLL